jgi:hypothetical protein
MGPKAGKTGEGQEKPGKAKESQENSLLVSIASITPLNI